VVFLFGVVQIADCMLRFMAFGYLIILVCFVLQKNGVICTNYAPSWSNLAEHFGFLHGQILVATRMFPAGK
jgi:hypothetical protein